MNNNHSSRTAPVFLRLKRSLEGLRSRLFRFLGIKFYNLSKWCNHQVKSGSRLPEGQKKKHPFSMVQWYKLLQNSPSRRALCALLDGGILGNDFPRSYGGPAGNRILVLAAHQDDEIVGAGGTLIMASQEKKILQVVYYTDGATRFGSFPLDEVTQLRNSEAHSVWKRLSSRKPLFMGVPNRADEIPPQAGQQLAEIIRDYQPTTIFVPLFFEHPLDHMRMSELLARADAVCPLDEQVEIWGYQITTRIPGNAVVDITSVWRKKYRLNKLWHTQNAFHDYPKLAMGRDIANSYYLKGAGVPNHRTGHAEVFLKLPAREYLTLAKAFLEMPEKEPLQASPSSNASPPDFFIVGMQKSGTYWLTGLLDSHPNICCFPSQPGRSGGIGEAHLFDGLAKMDSDFDAFRKSMKVKLNGLFQDLVPSQPFASEQEKDVFFEEIRYRFNEFCDTQRIVAKKNLVGEKTTETIHHLDLVEKLYPGVKKIVILRDPRDRLVSFHYQEIRKARIANDSPITREKIDAYIERIQKDYKGLLIIQQQVFLLT